MFSYCCQMSKGNYCDACACHLFLLKGNKNYKNKQSNVTSQEEQRQTKGKKANQRE